MHRLKTTLRRTLAGMLVVTAAVSAQTPPDGEPTPGSPAKEASSADTPLPTVAERTAELERLDGLLTLHVDRRGGTVWLELPPPSQPDGEIARYLYVESLRRGLGSNPIGLDRGQLGDSRVVRLRRLGPKVLLEQLNLRFRARSESLDERRAVEDSFATSVLWGGPIGALDADGRALVDIGSFVVRDAHGVVRTLKRSEQGDFRLDATRSAFDPEACLAFPDNVELEAVLTFTSDMPGTLVASVVPTSSSLTLVQHHSLIRLPDDGYRPRRFDPRAASFAVSFADYAADLDEPLETRWIARHRLEKIDPGATQGRVRKPIVYYVDRGAPEPVRSALVEGAGWWAEAFERAGFIDGFRVELLPEDAHVLDVRYNVIQWVHRSTRGWSYGGSITDPRTGEIIKGHVSLGSLRVRQDRLLFEGLAGTAPTGTGRVDDPIELSLARLRQLSAHEVGHTLGFAHNFAASTYGDRASVMDYPAPLIGLTDDGELDFSRAYGVGVGVWDHHAVRYAYQQVAPGDDEEAMLERIIREGLERGLLFVSDADARPRGSAHPLAHLWDNGDDPVTALRTAGAVRRAALRRFGEGNVATGRPLSLLHEVFVPVYLHHRYQIEAASKLVGGVDYRYSVRGDGQPTARPVEATRQRAALAALLECLDPDELRVPDRIVDLLVPRPFGYDTNRELLVGATSPAFDPAAAETVLADLVIAMLLDPRRAARLDLQKTRDQTLPGLADVIEQLRETLFAPTETPDERLMAIRWQNRQVFVERLIELAEGASTMPAVTAIADGYLQSVARAMDGLAGGTSRDRAQARSLWQQVRRHADRQVAGPRNRARIDPAPPGSPIGAAGPDWGGCGSGEGI